MSMMEEEEEKKSWSYKIIFTKETNEAGGKW